MKTLRYLNVLLGMLVLAGGLRAKDFEGMIRLKMTGQDMSGRRSKGDGSMFMNYYLKGGLMRVDMDAGNGQMFSSIVDPAKRQTIMLMPAQKMYMVHPLPEAKNTDATVAARTDGDFVRTGETETILGYKCQKIIVKSRDGTAEIWGAEGLGIFQSMGKGSPMGRPAPKSAWEALLAEHGFFPLRMVSRDASGKEVMRMEAVSIDPQTPADSLFVPPADYQQLEMPNFGGMSPFGR